MDRCVEYNGMTRSNVTTSVTLPREGHSKLNRHPLLTDDIVNQIVVVWYIIRLNGLDEIRTLKYVENVFDNFDLVDLIISLWLNYLESNYLATPE